MPKFQHALGSEKTQISLRIFNILLIELKYQFKRLADQVKNLCTAGSDMPMSIQCIGHRIVAGPIFLMKVGPIFCTEKKSWKQCIVMESSNFFYRK